MLSYPWLWPLHGQFIPASIQAATSIGIGLLTALAGSLEIGLVVRGKYTLVDMGKSVCAVPSLFFY
jgi:xanthine/uracil/vitamin C permease (AzgA family)